MTPAVGESEARIAALVRGRLGEEIASVEPLAGGLGLRRFFRVRSASGRSAIARVEAEEDPAGRPPGIPPEPPLEPVRALLERAGLPVPRSLGRAQGVDLLEDFGDESLASFAASAPAPDTERLVARALDLLPRLQRIGDDASGVEAFARRLDAPYFAYKADLFARYSLPDALGRAARASEDAALREAFAWIGEQATRAPQRLSHRDFQSQNLLVRADGALGLIDLQGAFLAPPEYDLVCLLRDSYLELDERFVASELARVRPALPDAPSPSELEARFELLTLTRKGKDHARFLYAAKERGDARYQAFAPRTARVLARASQRAAGYDARIARLAELLARWAEP
ncbi:MAG TPA: phosphotransferase [Myxococcota bacterium]|nr:phosphotransferase [Myxococcota bacterium]